MSRKQQDIDIPERIIINCNKPPDFRRGQESISGKAMLIKEM
jgi:hypothetical protein